MSDAELIDSIWGVLPQRATRKTKTALADLRTSIEGRKDPVSVALTKDTKATWDGDQMQALVTALLDEYATNGRSKLVISIFRTVAARWNQLTEHDCPPPAPMFSTKRAMHPRRYGLVRALRERNGYRDALGKALRAVKKKGGSEPDWLALTILSGLCQFQWLHKDAVLAVVEACANPEKSFILINQRIGLWYGLPLSGDSYGEKRISILDPLTAVLSLRTAPEEAKDLLGADSLAKMPLADKTTALRKLAQRLNAMLAKHAPQMKEATLDHMIRACSVAAYNWLAPAIISYLKREYVSGSTPPTVLARMEQSVQLLQVGDEAEQLAPARAETAIRSGGRESHEVQEAGGQEMPKYSPAFTAAMVDGKRAAIRTAFDRIRENETLPSIARLLAEFGLDLIGNRGSKTLDSGTLRVYMRLLMRFLAPQFDLENVVGMDTNDLEDRYQSACDDFVASPAGKAPSSRSRFIILLLRWHDFLVDNYGFEELEDFSPFVAGALPINANVLSIEEFQKYLSVIVKSSSIPQEEKLTGVLVSALGMLGARRSEALYLLPEDVDPEQVLLRRNRFRSLKTRNAVRRIILALLPLKMGQMLCRLAKRQQDRGRHTLFSSEQGGIIKEEGFFEQLLRILRESCQDSTLKFHSLRHTAATLATVALLCEDTTLIGELLPSLTKTLEFLGNGAGLREAMYGTTEIHWCDLISVATNLGHGSAQATTLPHYAHAMFLVHAAGILSQTDLAPLTREVALASGKNASAYRRIKGPESIETFLFRERFVKQIAEATAKRTKRESRSQVVNVESLTEYERGFRCARMAVEETVSISQLSKELHMSSEKASEVTDILAELLGAEKKAGPPCSRAN